MANSGRLDTSGPFAGLGTSTYIATVAGLHSIDVQSTIPLGSALQIVINKNGSAQVTVGGSATSPSSTQTSIGAQCSLNLAVADAITVVLTSANAVDSVPNTVKSVISVFVGQ